MVALVGATANLDPDLHHGPVPAELVVRTSSGRVCLFWIGLFAANNWSRSCPLEQLAKFMANATDWSGRCATLMLVLIGSAVVSAIVFDNVP